MLHLGGLFCVLAGLQPAPVWSLSRALLPPLGGPIVAEGVAPPNSPLPSLRLSSPGGRVQLLKAHGVAVGPEGTSWQASAVLDPNLTDEVQVWILEGEGRREEIAVQPQGVSGFGAGVKASYFLGRPSGAPASSRMEPVPGFSQEEQLPGAVRHGDFTVRWEGVITFPLEGDWTVKVETERSVLLGLGQEKPQKQPERAWKAKAGERVPFLLESGPDAALRSLAFLWRKGEGPWEPIPRGQLDPPGPGHAPVTLTLKPQGGEIILRGSAPSVIPPCLASSPYEPVQAWVQAISEKGVVAQAPLGMPLVLPASKPGWRQPYRLRFLATDAAGQRAEAEGPPVYVDPVPVAPPPQKVPFDDYHEPRQDPEARALPAGPSLYRPMAEEAAKRWGLDPAVFCRMIEVESSWNPLATSPAGAMGLGQLMPGTAEMLGVEDPYDPASNLEGAARYLAQQLRRFGTYRLALAAYNAGPGAVSRHKGVPPYRETQNYVKKILGR